MRHLYLRLVGFRAMPEYIISAALVPFALCMAMLPGYGQWAPGASALTVPKHVGKVGDVRRYRLTLTIHSKGARGEQVVKVAETLRTTVQEVRADGGFTLLDEFESGTAIVGGKEIDVLPLLPVVTLTRTGRGQFMVKAEKGNPEGNAEVAGVLQQLAAVGDNFVPRKPGKAGDRWKIAYTNANRMLGGAKLTGEAELVGTERIDDIETVKIKYRANGDEKERDRSHIEGTVLWQAGQGGIVRLSQEGRGTFAGGPAEVVLEVALLTKEAGDPKSMCLPPPSEGRDLLP